MVLENNTVDIPGMSFEQIIEGIDLEESAEHPHKRGDLGDNGCLNARSFRDGIESRKR